MIPAFAPNGDLPPGIHWSTWDEIVERFGRSTRRQTLLAGLRLAIDELRVAGCRTVYVDGSFVSATANPGDFDACWDSTGVMAANLDPALIAYDGYRRGQIARYGGELFVADGVADLYGTLFLDYFQRSKDTGDAKGIVGLRLEDGQ